MTPKNLMRTRKMFIAVAGSIWLLNLLLSQVSGMENPAEVMRFKPINSKGSLMRGDSASHLRDNGGNFASNSQAVEIELKDSEKSFTRREKKNKIVRKRKNSKMKSKNGPKVKELVVLQSFDGEKFTIEKEIAVQSPIIKIAVEDFCETDTTIVPLPNVEAVVLERVIDWFEYHHESNKELSAMNQKDALKRKEEITHWEVEFVNKMDEKMLFKMILSANYLDIERLSDVASQNVVDRIKNKTVDQLEEIFNMKPTNCNTPSFPT